MLAPERTQGISAGPEDTGIRIARPPEGFQSLREILRYLHQQDEPSRIIALRRVQRLGLEAHDGGGLVEAGGGSQ